MDITIPDIDTIWSEDGDDDEVEAKMTEVLRDLFFWADKHAVMLYFDERPDVPPTLYYRPNGEEIQTCTWGDEEWKWVRNPDESMW